MGWCVCIRTASQDQTELTLNECFKFRSASAPNEILLDRLVLGSGTTKLENGYARTNFNQTEPVPGVPQRGFGTQLNSVFFFLNPITAELLSSSLTFSFLRNRRVRLISVRFRWNLHRHGQQVCVHLPTRHNRFNLSNE